MSSVNDFKHLRVTDTPFGEKERHRDNSMKSIGITPKCLIYQANLYVQTFQGGMGLRRPETGLERRISVRNCVRMIEHPKAPPSPLTPPFNILVSHPPAHARMHPPAPTLARYRVPACVCVHSRGYFIACACVRVTPARSLRLSCQVLTY